MISSDKNFVLQTNNPEFAAASESGIGPISIGNETNQWIKQNICRCWRSSKQPWRHEEWTLEYMLRVNDLLVIFILIWGPFLSVHVFVPWPPPRMVNSCQITIHKISGDGWDKKKRFPKPPQIVWSCFPGSTPMLQTAAANTSVVCGSNPTCFVY